MQSRDQYDYLIIGAGIAGLSSGVTLAHSGKKVLILERSKDLGGCASTYTKSGYRFEAGATTLVGFGEGLPLTRVFEHVGKNPKDYFDFFSLNPSQKIILKDGKEIWRGDRKEFVKNCIAIFGNQYRQTIFWNLVYWTAKTLWKMSSEFVHFPFLGFSDFWECLKKMKLSYAIAFVFSLVSVQTILKILFLEKNTAWKEFLNEQLVISTQSDIGGTPFLLGSAGLSYAELPNQYIVGGIGGLAEGLAKVFSEFGGSIFRKSEVVSIRKQEEAWEVQTKKGEIYFASSIISGIPIWNLSRIFEDSNLDSELGELSSGLISFKSELPASSLRMESTSPKLQKEISSLLSYLVTSSKKFDSKIWGAFTWGVVVKDLAPFDSIHTQIHSETPIPFHGGNSVFVSASHPSDLSRGTKSNETILAVSTHASEEKSWDRKSKDYISEKNIVTDFVISLLEKNYRGFRRENISILNMATPSTWEIWSGRWKGRVGGIPAEHFPTPFHYLSNFTKSKSFFLIGDTTYPGQGIPGVALSGFHLALRILEKT